MVIRGPYIGQHYVLLGPSTDGWKGWVRVWLDQTGHPPVIRDVRESDLRPDKIVWSMRGETRSEESGK